MKLNVKVEYNQAAREFKQIAKRLPSITRDAINKTATLAERQAIEETAKEMKLPQKFVRNRYTMTGEAKDKRVRIRRASVSRLTAELEVYMRGLPVSQVAGKQIMRKGGGVKATGGRFYRGAFRVEKGRYARQVFKRMGEERTPLMVPKIGLRQRLTRKFNENVTGSSGRERFRREYNERIRAQLSKAGVRV